MLDSMRGVWTHPRLKVKDWRGENVRYIQPKWDGWCLMAFMQEGENGLCVFGRKHEAHLEMSHLLECRPWYRRLARGLEPGMSVVGEMYVPGQPASAVVTAMKDPSLPLELAVFAVPAVDFKVTPISMEDARQGLHRLGLDTPITVQYTEQTRDDLMQYAREWGTEGVVLKQGHWEGWYKVKTEQTVDLICTGLKMAEVGTEFYGHVGSIRGSAYVNGVLTEVACVSGMTLETRRAITKADIGRPFEATYQYIAAGGRLRHPRFNRWRDDKPAHECTLEAQ